jgi:hypothetical protein
MRAGKIFGRARGHTDQEAQELLRQVDAWRSVDKAADLEPPALVDQAVRNLARRELQTPPPPIGGKLRWLAGLSTVSVALIALGIALVQSPQVAAPTMDPASSPAKARGIELESRREDTPPLPLPQAEAVDASAVASEQAAPAYSLSNQADEASLADQANRTESDEPGQAALAKASSAKAPSAQAWLDLAKQLFDQGLHAEAREQLQALVVEYPGFPLPEWATALLQAEP